MSIFKISQNKLTPIKEKPIKLEKDLQKLMENNLETIFDLKFLATEFSLHEFRIDTLAFDEESKAFVIIEYKKDKNFSVIDQGYAYLSLMLENKADFILEYNERMNKNLKKQEVDWSQSRIIFVAPFFTNYQQNAINFKDLPIELWKTTKYENDTILFDQIQSSNKSESINTVSKNQKIQRVSKEVKVYSEEDHLKIANSEARELYQKLKERILSLGDDITIKSKKLCVGFFVSKNNFVDISLQKNQIKLWLNLRKGSLDDPKGFTRNVHGVGHWGNGDYEVTVTSNTDLDYLMTLVKQAYNNKL